MNYIYNTRAYGRYMAIVSLLAIHLLPSPAASASEPGLHVPTDTLYLEELRIIGTRIQVPDHLQPVFIQSVAPGLLRDIPYESAAYHLAGSTFTMVRDYGEGNMSLVSQRGFSPVHTRITWEEMPLNHPMLGMFDLSRIPAGLLDGISSSSGNPAAMSGSGGIGGTLSLRTRTHPDRFFFSRSAGSYGFTQTGLGGALRNRSFDGGIRMFRQSGDFDFRYDDPDPDQPQSLKRANNRSESTHVLAHGSYQRNDWSFRSLFWLDDTENNLPGSIYFLSPGRQEDRSARMLLQSGYDGWERTWLTATAGWYQYEMAYEDPFTNPADASTVRMYLIQPALRHAWSPGHESHFALQIAAHSIDASTYPGVKQQQSLSVRWNHAWNAVSRLVMYPSVEWEWHSRFHDTLNPALGLTYQPVENILTLRAMAGKNRNNPTYNDRYWQPSGNPDLHPETVYSFEAGATLVLGNVRGSLSSNTSSAESMHSGNQTGALTAGFTLFRHDFRDGIRWIEGEDGMFAPENVEKLRSQGVEFSVQAVRTLGLFRFDLQYMVTRTDAALQRERFRGDGSVGRQMVYVPEWTHKGVLQLHARSQFWSRLSIRNTGERFTTMDHSSPLDPLSAYTRADIDTGWEGRLRSVVLRVSIGVRNLADQRYEVISGYPVAPRHYRAALAMALR